MRFLSGRGKQEQRHTSSLFLQAEDSLHYQAAKKQPEARHITFTMDHARPTITYVEISMPKKTVCLNS